METEQQQDDKQDFLIHAACNLSKVRFEWSIYSESVGQQESDLPIADDPKKQRNDWIPISLPDQ